MSVLKPPGLRPGVLCGEAANVDKIALAGKREGCKEEARFTPEIRLEYGWKKSKALKSKKSKQVVTGISQATDQHSAES